MTVTLRYADAPATITAHVIHRYRAGEIPSQGRFCDDRQNPLLTRLLRTDG